MLTVEHEGNVMLNEVGYVKLGDKSLKAEVIRIKGNLAEMQVFEMTRGIGIGDEVTFTNELLSIELGFGSLITSMTSLITQ